MTEKEKMLKGEIYDSEDAELTKLRDEADRLTFEYNQTLESETEKREEILKKLVPNHGKKLNLRGPIHFDYGKFTTFGDNCYANFNLVILDVCPVTIGNNVFFGPNCSIVTALHPIASEERNSKQNDDGSLRTIEYGNPVTIKDGVWCGSNVTVCAGTTIGENCVIGAGSVVTRDIPPNSVAVGVPCKVIRKITDKDKMM